MEKKFFCLWDNSISIGFVKFSVLRKEYLSSAANMLTNSLKILHSTKRDICRFNYLHNDQEIS